MNIWLSEVVKSPGTTNTLLYYVLNSIISGMVFCQCISMSIICLILYTGPSVGGNDMEVPDEN